MAPFEAAIDIEGLRRKGFVETNEIQGFREGEYMAISLLQPGIDWLLDNQSRFVMRADPSAQQGALEGDEVIEDDIPF